MLNLLRNVYSREDETFYESSGCNHLSQKAPKSFHENGFITPRIKTNYMTPDLHYIAKVDFSFFVHLLSPKYVSISNLTNYYRCFNLQSHFIITLDRLLLQIGFRDKSYLNENVFPMQCNTVILLYIVIVSILIRLSIYKVQHLNLIRKIYSNSINSVSENTAMLQRLSLNVNID